MQGRLLPKYQGRYQAFPVGNWKDEFKVAKEGDNSPIKWGLVLPLLQKILSQPPSAAWPT